MQYVKYPTTHNILLLLNYVEYLCFSFINTNIKISNDIPKCFKDVILYNLQFLIYTQSKIPDVISQFIKAY